MFDFIYVEEEVADHPRVVRICARFPDAQQIVVERYGEVFNRRAQDFRLQKQRPALILANKHGRRILEAPAGYGIGSSRNFYFSHMLNCLYDCRYCFLQGMYRSAHMVVFVNYEDFQDDLHAVIKSEIGSAPAPDTTPPHFFTGYDCDSLAMESVTGFASEFLSYFAAHPHALFEFRTKSVAIDRLLATDPIENVVIAYSLTPEAVGQRFEIGAPPLASRLSAMARLQEAGWVVGLRFDPLIYYEGFRDGFRELLESVFHQLDAGLLHSVCLGPFRLPRDFYKRMRRLYPEESLLAYGLEDSDGVYSYRSDLMLELSEFCSSELMTYIPDSIFFSTFAGTER